MFFTDGKIEYAGFFGNDLLFLKWTNDLLNYYWSMAKNIVSL
jgi:predicted transcriptional regulator